MAEGNRLHVGCGVEGCRYLRSYRLTLENPQALGDLGTVDEPRGLSVLIGLTGDKDALTYFTYHFRQHYAHDHWPLDRPPEIWHREDKVSVPYHPAAHL